MEISRQKKRLGTTWAMHLAPQSIGKSFVCEEMAAHVESGQKELLVQYQSPAGRVSGTLTKVLMQQGERPYGQKHGRGRRTLRKRRTEKKIVKETLPDRLGAKGDDMDHRLIKLLFDKFTPTNTNVQVM